MSLYSSGYTPLRCSRCGKSEMITSVPSATRGADILLCFDCCDKYDDQYDKFIRRFCKYATRQAKRKRK